MAGAPIPSGDCPSSDGCESFAASGVCLADGTPIAVITSRDCATGEVSQDGWIDLTTGDFTSGPPPGGTIACGDNYSFALSGWLCDVLGDGSVAGIALVQIERDAQGAVIGITLIGVDGLPYVPQGTMERCPSDDVEAEVLCDAGNGGAPFVRFYTYSASGVIPSRDTDLDGNPYVVVGPVDRCGDAVTIPDPLNVEVVNTPLDVTGTVNIGNLADPLPVEVSNFPASQTVDGVVDVGNFPDDTEFEILCDFPPLFPDPLLPVLQFIRRYDVDGAGTVTVTDTELDGVTPHVPYVGGRVATCEVGFRDFEPIILCDVGAGGTQFARHYRDTAIGVLTTDTLLDGITPYTAIGPISVCAEVTGSGGGPVAVDGTVDVGNLRDDEYEALCDTVGSFLRRYRTDSAGVVTTADFTLDGVTPYVPVGAISVCSDVVNTTVDVNVTGSDCADAEYLELVDCTDTRFLRRIDRDCDGTLTVTDTNLDGTTPFAACDPVRFASEGGLQSGAGGPAIVTRVVSAATYTTSVLARRVTIIWTGNAASIGNRVTLSINGGPFVPLVNQAGTIIFGDLSSPDAMGYTITVNVNQAQDDVTVVEEF